MFSFEEKPIVSPFLCQIAPCLACRNSELYLSLSLRVVVVVLNLSLPAVDFTPCNVQTIIAQSCSYPGDAAEDLSRQSKTEGRHLRGGYYAQKSSIRD
jgi:hypothetical protein